MRRAHHIRRNASNKREALSHRALFSLVDVESETVYSIYPNPSNGIINLKVTLLKVTDVTFTIYDLNGKKIYSLTETEKLNSGSQNLVFDLRNKLSKGIYCIKVKIGDIETSEKIILE